LAVWNVILNADLAELNFVDLKTKIYFENFKTIYDASNLKFWYFISFFGTKFAKDFFGSLIELLVNFFVKNQNFGENGIFGQKWKFWSKLEILVKNGNFGQKSKFWPKMEILVKTRNFGEKWKFWSKIEILAKNRNFREKWKFWSTNKNFGQKSKHWPKIEFLVENEILPKNPKNRNFNKII